MDGYLSRNLEQKLAKQLNFFPVLAVLGPRQCGKSTLLKHIQSNFPEILYLDLEKPSDLRSLTEAELFFESNKDRLICLDEIQRVPELFPVLRSIVDQNERPGQFIVLGSAAPDLLKQSSESLAGRISYLELTPFLLDEVQNQDGFDFNSYWLRGGFPKSYLAPDDELSLDWRLNFIQTFLERDIQSLGFSIPSQRIHRLWMMLSHYHGGVLNRSKIADSLGVSSNTVQSYIDILEQTFMVRLLRPYEGNFKKRLVKSPKIYLRDSGLLHALLGLDDFNDVLGHAQLGASYEGLCIENILSFMPNWNASFYRTKAGAEIDLVLEKGQKRIGFEFKASKSPKPSRGFWQAIEDLSIDQSYVVAPVDGPYLLKKDTKVLSLSMLIDNLN